MKFKITKQVKTFFIVVAILILALFIFRKVTEGFSSEVTYDKLVEVDTKNPVSFTITKNELIQNAKGKKKLTAIRFAKYYKDPNTGKLGFDLEDDPKTLLQNSGGPTVEFVKPNLKAYKNNPTPRTIYSSEDDKNIEQEFPISLDDIRISEGIVIRNLTSTLSRPLICRENPNPNTRKNKPEICQAGPKFDFSSNKENIKNENGKNLRIRFVFTD